MTTIVHACIIAAISGQQSPLLPLSTDIKHALGERSSRVTELEQEVEVLEGELSAAQEAASQAPSRTMKSLVERLRNQLAIKEKQHKV